MLVIHAHLPSMPVGLPQSEKVAFIKMVMIILRQAAGILSGTIKAQA